MIYMGFRYWPYEACHQVYHIIYPLVDGRVNTTAARTLPLNVMLINTLSADIAWRKGVLHVSALCHFAVKRSVASTALPATACPVLQLK